MPIHPGDADEGAKRSMWRAPREVADSRLWIVRWIEWDSFLALLACGLFWALMRGLEAIEPRVPTPLVMPIEIVAGTAYLLTLFHFCLAALIAWKAMWGFESAARVRSFLSRATKEGWGDQLRVPPLAEREIDRAVATLLLRRELIGLIASFVLPTALLMIHDCWTGLYDWWSGLADLRLDITSRDLLAVLDILSLPHAAPLFIAASSVACLQFSLRVWALDRSLKSSISPVLWELARAGLLVATLMGVTAPAFFLLVALGHFTPAQDMFAASRAPLLVCYYVAAFGSSAATFLISRRIYARHEGALGRALAAGEDFR